ncbi:ribosomal biogenesis protein LAS1, partial [Tremellales sp. Uapishka_1]
MRAPRRVPWASRAELAELYDLVFPPSASAESLQSGLSRMSIYISSPSCPAFLHLLYSMLVASLLPYPPTSASEAQTSRLTYSMAIVRFVNGMVDPLQTGPYARPISHLASQLGLPPSLIALRHRATHEDLPPIELLHNAIHDAIGYLQHYSFLPLLASTSEDQWNAGEPSGRIVELISRWKKVIKVRLREKEVGEENPNGRELKRVRRELEQSEVEDVVEALCGVGGLVPVARKKRPTRDQTGPSSSSLLLWQPLLSHLHTFHPTFSPTLASHILGIILNPPPTAIEADQEKEIQSFRWGLACWLIHVFPGLEQGEKKRLGKMVMEGLISGDIIVRRLCDTLTEVDQDFGRMANGLQRLLPDTSGSESEPVGDAAMDNVDMTVDAMEERLRAMEEKLSRKDVRPVVDVDAEIVRTNGSGIEVGGWKKLQEGEWRVCPIGMWGCA